MNNVWMHSKTFDIFFFFSFFIFLIILFSENLLGLQPLTKPLFLNTRVYLLHLHTLFPITAVLIFSVFLNRQKITLHLFKVLIIPTLLFASILGLSHVTSSDFYIKILFALGLIFTTWNLYHFSIQNYGFYSIYSKLNEFTDHQHLKISKKLFILNGFILTSVVFYLVYNKSYNPHTVAISAFIDKERISFFLQLTVLLISSTSIIYVLSSLYTKKINFQLSFLLFIPIFQNLIFLFLNLHLFYKLALFAFPHVLGEIGICYLIYKYNKKVNASNNKFSIYSLSLILLTIGVFFLLYSLNNPAYQTLISEGVYDPTMLKVVQDSLVLKFGLFLFYSHTIMHFVSDRILFKMSDSGDLYGVKAALLKGRV